MRVFSLLATLERYASLNSFCLVEGGGFLRRQIFARLTGEHASVAFDGVSLLRKRCLADTTLVVDHASAHGKSRERFRTILDESLHRRISGQGHVRQAAQKTDGAMQSKALLLSDGAAMNNKPELEIFADDVVCGHGATCGRLDADQLFYLMARGLPRREAEALLVEGFANEAMDGIADEALAGRLCDGCRRMARGPGGADMNAPLQSALLAYDVEAIRARLPHPRRASLWQAACLSRQCGVGAKAARRHRAADAFLRA